MAGSLIVSEAHMPRTMLSSAHRYSKAAKLLAREAVAHWNEANRRLLETFGIKIIAIEEMELRPARSMEGRMELLLSERASLSMALSALAVALKGRGDLLDVPADRQKDEKTHYKEMADLRAAATEMEVLQSLVDEHSNIAFLVRVGEGGGDAGRRKPGESLNASLYPGQIIANRQYAGLSLEELEARGVEVCRIATDPIDGTSKTVMSEPSALTAILITRGEIRTVPDVYMEKLTLDSVASHAGLTTDDALDKVVQGLADTHKVAPGQINGFALKRDRHPVQPLLDLGINVVLDTDGDLLPGLMPGVQPGVYANGLPLNAMVGNTGGAAEYLIAATANRWAGGASHGRFVSAAGMKAKGWEGRYDFTPEDRSVIEGAGFKVGVNYSVTELVDITDGLAVFAGITSNSHLPQLSGVYVGSNYAQVDVVKVGASGRITKRRFTLHFERPYDAMVTGFDPVTEKLMTCDIRDVRGELRTILADSRRAERLQREIALSLYQIFTIGKGGKFAVQQDRLRELGDERTKAIVGNLMELKPEWFA